VIAPFLAHINDLRTLPCVVEEFGSREEVIDDYIGLFETLNGFDGDKARVTRPGAY
jgi:hypothetical protein